LHSPNDGALLVVLFGTEPPEAPFFGTKPPDAPDDGALLEALFSTDSPPSAQAQGLPRLAQGCTPSRSAQCAALRSAQEAPPH